MARKPAEQTPVIPDGAAAGSATVQYDEECNRYYHVRSDGSRCYHDVPEGYTIVGGDLVPAVLSSAPAEKVIDG
jgi:hypothetical protein